MHFFLLLFLYADEDDASFFIDPAEDVWILAQKIIADERKRKKKERKKGGEKERRRNTCMEMIQSLSPYSQAVCLAK